MTQTPKPLRPQPYMSVVPGRSPEQKAHMTLGHAKSAVGAKLNAYRGSYYDMAIYEWKNNGWELLYDIPKGTKVAPWKLQSEKERLARAAAAQDRARVAEQRRVENAAKEAYNAYLADEHSIYTSESFILAFEAGYAYAKTSKL